MEAVCPVCCPCLAVVLGALSNVALKIHEGLELLKDGPAACTIWKTLKEHPGPRNIHCIVWGG